MDRDRIAGAVARARNATNAKAAFEAGELLAITNAQVVKHANCWPSRMRRYLCGLKTGNLPPFHVLSVCDVGKAKTLDLYVQPAMVLS